MNKHVFAINGTGGSGKDLFVSLVKAYYEHPVYNISFVDKVKEIAELMGWKGGKTEKDRQFLAALEKLSSDYSDMPYQDVASKTWRYLYEAPEDSVVFIHIRRPEQIKRAVEEFGAKTILVSRAQVEPIVSNEADASVNNFEYDIHVLNDGTKDELSDIAEEFANDIASCKMKFTY